jgi:predicted phage-related endonuclease
MNRDTIPIESRGQWLQLRKGDLTASAIAALFNVHPYLSPEQLVEEKRGLYDRGDSPAMRRGRILEPAVIEALHEEHPDWRLERAATYHRLPDYRLGCTPDCWLDDDGLVQCKTVAPEEWQRWGGRPPLAYTLQTLTELLVTGKSRGYLAIMVLNRAYPVILFPVPRHEGAEAKIIAAATSWWSAFDAGLSPVADDAAALAADLDDGSHKDLSSDNELPGLLAERQDLVVRAKVDETRLKEIDSTIKDRNGTARTAI